MTNEEREFAKSRIEYLLKVDDFLVKHDREALEMAIQALSQEPCDDAISRDAVLDALLDYWHDTQFVDGSGYDVYEDCKAVIDELPSVTPKRKIGYWLKTGQSFLNPNKFRNFCCTECSHELEEHIRKEPNYCPNCGARMVEPQESEEV